MRVAAVRSRSERPALVGLSILALIGCAIGLIAPPSSSLDQDLAQQILDLLRVVATLALVVVLVMGPGLLWRVRTSRHIELCFLPLPGIGLLVGVGLFAWAFAVAASPRLTCALILVPVLLYLLVSFLRLSPEPLLDPHERWALLIVGCVLGIATAKALWSLGPVGELYGGTISRTLEVGPLSDSRISYHVAQLVAHGENPYSVTGAANFLPYNFSDRGPLAGLASAPIVLVSGGRPPVGLPSQPWSPFDAQGFMAYRLAVMVFASSAFVSLWSLTRRLGDARAARFGLLVAATTPFLVHEVWFTWPKMLAASFVLVAYFLILDELFFVAGLAVGAGYLTHPSALLALPALALLVIWPIVGARLWRPRLFRLSLFVAGTGVLILAWRLVNGSHFSQSAFLQYIRQAGSHTPVTAWAWISDRVESLANTVIPLRSFFFSTSDPLSNVVGGSSPAVVHFFFQYWSGIPFGLGILFLPMLVIGLWKAVRTWPWPVMGTVAIPFVVWAVYWGSFSSGLMLDGLHAVILAAVIVIALEQRHQRYSWLRFWPSRLILALRSLEVLLLATVPTIATRHALVATRFELTDVCALVVMTSLCAVLGWSLWRESHVGSHAPSTSQSGRRWTPGPLPAGSP